MRALLFMIIWICIVWGDDMINDEISAQYLQGEDEPNMDYHYVAMDFGAAGLFMSLLFISVCINMSFCCLILTGSLTWKNY